MVAVGTNVTCQTREHQAQAVEQFRRGAERAADTGNAGALTQCKSCRDVKDLVDGRFGSHRHAAPRVG